jgi:hypothetical protein
MEQKKLHGKEGEIILSYQNTVFAYAERFTAEMITQAQLIHSTKIGAYRIATGYKARICLNDVTVHDNDTVNKVIQDLNAGIFPEIGFRGKYRRKDGLAESILFGSCLLSGEINMIELLNGFTWDLELEVNKLTDEHIRAFEIHG